MLRELPRRKLGEFDGAAVRGRTCVSCEVLISGIVAKTSPVARDDKATAAGSPGAARERSDAPVLPGDVVVGKYRMGPFIGFAGMGTVYEGVHIDLGIPVALIIARPADASDEGAVDRFLSGARSTAQLRSQHVRRVLDCGRIEGERPYVVLEYLEGADLRSVLTTHGSLPVEEAVSLTLQACDALAEAHSRGMVHGDVRPEHLFLSRGSDGGALVKVLGLGIAKQNRVGSPLHRSPEQMCDPTAVDARTDVWSLGVVLYELFTGELPFEGDSVSEVRANVKTAHPRSPRDLDPAISKGLAALVLRCLAKAPDARFPDAVALGHALRAFGASAASISAARVEDILRHAGSMPPASPSSSQEAADEEIVRSSWLTDPPATPRSSPTSSSPESVEGESVRASWLMDPPETPPMPAASQSVPAVPAPVLASSPPSMPAASRSVPATPPPLPTSQSVPAGPTSHRTAPPPLPTSNALRLSNPTLRLPTTLRLPKLLLPTTQRARVAVAGGLLGGLILALFWPNRPRPVTEPTAPAVSAAAPASSAAPAVAEGRAASPPSTVPPAESALLASAAPSASPAPPSSQAPVLASAPSSEPARASSASPKPGVTTTTTIAATKPAARPPAPPARSRSSSLFPVPKPLSW